MYHKKWSYVDTSNFLDSYQSHANLWNPDDKDYNNLTLRYNTYKEMAHELKIPNLNAKTVRNRIGSIRRMYNVQLLKLVNSAKSESGESLYKPTIWWYDKANAFLRNVVKRKRIRKRPGPVRIPGVFKHGWNEEEVSKFLDIYEYYECLWNVHDNYYKNDRQRKLACLKIMEDMNVADIKDLRLKIRSIRVTYYHQLERVLTSEKRINEFGELVYSYIPKIVWFHKADSFLRTGVQPWNPRQSKKYVYDDCEVTYNELETVEDKEIGLQNQLTYDEDNDADIYIDTEYLLESDETTNYLNDLPNNNTEDEFDLFGRRVAEQLRALNLHRAQFCEDQIQSILTNELHKSTATVPSKQTNCLKLPEVLNQFCQTIQIQIQRTQLTDKSNPIT